MKRSILYSFYLFIAGLLLVTGAIAQTGLVPDQNPNYMASRDRYMKIADSVNLYQSTTSQETYHAIDYLEDKRQARADRRAFRRELRLERARYGGYDYNYNDNYTPYYNNNYPLYNDRNYRYGRGWNSYYFRRSLPFAATIGSLGWWWCR